MGLVFFKRYWMELDLRGWTPQEVELPAGYCLLAWHADLLAAHAQTKYESFREDLDAVVFPCLGQQEGCRRLMEEITRSQGFLPEATWLAVYRAEGQSRPVPCGTIQGIVDAKGRGAVQNLGVVPQHRRRGLGRALLCRALQGFQQAGLERAGLEVTAENAGAVRLYRQMGFRHVETLYKASLAPAGVS